jgi:glycosyltransferase involved in cell wall biosynthesis
MSDYPLVSVLMTCFNREKFIGEAIESVQASGYPNFELLIVDDASVDRTASIAHAYAQKDKRIRIFINSFNLGDYPNRNKAAGLANGKYIVYTDSDDAMFAGSLLKWVDGMEKHKAQFGIFVSGCFTEPTQLPAAASIRYHFFHKPLLMYGPGATITTKDYFRTIGGFPEKYGPANDMYFNLKAASQTSTVYFPFPVCNYRLHEGQEINNHYGYLINSYCYQRDALDELGLHLTEEEIRFLSAVNKRRFVTNCMNFLLASKDIRKTFNAVRKAKFSLLDFSQTLYIKSLKKGRVK